MTRHQHEIEATFTVPAETVGPSFEQLPGVDAVRTESQQALEATYFDTRDLVLAEAGISLRRRTGGADAGWHLVLPTKQGRHEVPESLDRAVKTVPKSLRDLLVLYTRGDRPHPVAVIRTQRRRHHLLDEDERVLAEFCDDHVSAELVGESGSIEWRAWRLELVHGDRDLLGSARDMLEEAGGEFTRSTELTRALGDRVRVHQERVSARPTRTSPASSVVQSRLITQVRALQSHDPLVRRDAPDAVHRMRVSVRRLRNALATFRPLLVRAPTESIRTELKWLAAALGEPRDAEVMRERLRTLIEREPVDVVRGAGYRRLDRHMGAAYAAARERMLAALSSERYFDLVDRLVDLAEHPPWIDGAAVTVDDALRRRVRHDYERLERRVRTADKTDDFGERERRLHDARKAAKRVRYAAEPLKPIYGKPAKRFVKAIKRVQESLGGHHDAFVTQLRLRELADEATRHGDNAFVLGVLHAREDRALSETDNLFEGRWHHASKKKRVRWLKD